MSSIAATALITGGSAIGGGLVVAGSNYVISRAQTNVAQVGSLRQALTALVSVLGQIETELRSEPQQKRTVRVVNEQLETRFPQIDYITGRLHRRIFQPHLDALIARFHDALAAVLLVAPTELLPALQHVMESMASPHVRSETWWATWDSAKSDLVVASRQALGYEGARGDEAADSAATDES